MIKSCLKQTKSKQHNITKWTDNGRACCRYDCIYKVDKTESESKRQTALNGHWRSTCSLCNKMTWIWHREINEKKINFIGIPIHTSMPTHKIHGRVTQACCSGDRAHSY